ncbi:MAG: PucR family transcriptional regulator [Clostridiales bacterium]|nr:PucR family transcriptional regulator [Clostridiales bacterium]
MKITVNDCLKLDAFQGCTVHACSEGLSRRVRTISVLDESDLRMGVERNGLKEQIVITHFWSSCNDITAQAEAVRGLGRKGISALVVYLNEHGVRSLDPEVVKAAEESEVPLIAIQDNGSSSYSELIEQVLDKILYGQNYSDNILNNTIYHLLNFDKHSNFPAALSEAALHNRYQVVLMTEEFNPILTVETRHMVKIEDAVQAARKQDAFHMNAFTRVEIGGVITYWGYIDIKDSKYILTIVDNDDEYSASEMTKLAETIQLAIGMWKYTPERDSRSEFIKSAVRGDLSFCHTLLDESGLRGMQFTSVFLMKDIDKDTLYEVMSSYRKNMDFAVLTETEDNETYGIVYADEGQEIGIQTKNMCLEAYEKLKSGRKDARIFHVTGINTLEAAVDGFRLISRTSKYIEAVFPYKRVFSKYEISMVCDCVFMQNSSSTLKKMYLDLLEPFEREVSLNKGRLLLETLSTFVLDAGMNSNKTAEFMNIHNNTVQYRLKKANEILGAEMTANRIIPGLTMALAIKRLEEK